MFGFQLLAVILNVRAYIKKSIINGQFKIKNYWNIWNIWTCKTALNHLNTVNAH